MDSTPRCGRTCPRDDRGPTLTTAGTRWPPPTRSAATPLAAGRSGTGSCCSAPPTARRSRWRTAARTGRTRSAAAGSRATPSCPATPASSYDTDGTLRRGCPPRTRYRSVPGPRLPGARRRVVRLGLAGRPGAGSACGRPAAALAPRPDLGDLRRRLGDGGRRASAARELRRHHPRRRSGPVHRARRCCTARLHRSRSRSPRRP